MDFKIDLNGRTFGDYTVIGFGGKKGHMTLWKCKCVCGSEKTVYGNNLLRGYSTSCGCKRAEKMRKTMTKHGLTDTRLHIIWIQMRARCEKPYSYGYKSYGGRGISVCKEWSDFQNFYAWAINNGYDKNLTLDRIDNDGNYEPSNCRWATQTQQCRNQRSNRNIAYQGEVHCLTEWAEITGIDKGVLAARLDKLNWSIQKAFSEPVKHIRRSRS